MFQLKRQIRSEEKAQNQKLIDIRRKFNQILQGGELRVELLRTLRHSREALSVSFSPDGRILASGSWDGTVKLWDVQSGEVIHSLEGHSDWVRSVAFSPDGTKLASGSFDRTIKIWEDPRVQERRREMSELMRSLYKANRRTRNRAGNLLPSEAGRKLYDPNIGRKIGEFL